MATTVSIKGIDKNVWFRFIYKCRIAGYSGAREAIVKLATMIADDKLELPNK